MVPLIETAVDAYSSGCTASEDLFFQVLSVSKLKGHDLK